MANNFTDSLGGDGRNIQKWYYIIRNASFTRHCNDIDDYMTTWLGERPLHCTTHRDMGSGRNVQCYTRGTPSYRQHTILRTTETTHLYNTAETCEDTERQLHRNSTYTQNEPDATYSKTGKRSPKRNTYSRCLGYTKIVHTPFNR